MGLLISGQSGRRAALGGLDCSDRPGPGARSWLHNRSGARLTPAGTPSTLRPVALHLLTIEQIRSEVRIRPTRAV